jgi:prophage tail gpP-like protein
MSTTFNFAEDDLPFPLGSVIQIMCNKVKVFTGFVENIGISLADNEYTISLSGRDILADFVDSTVGANGNIKTPIALKQIVRNLLDYLGMKYINVIDRLSPDVFSKVDAIQSNPTDTCYSVAERYAKKRQVFLMSNGNGDIIIDRPNDNPYSYIGRVREDGFVEVFEQGKEVIPTLRVNSESFSSNSVVRADLSLNDNTRFHAYRSRNQYNPMTGENRKKKLQDSVPGVNYTVIDEDIRKSRVMDVIYDSVNLAEDTKKHLEWEKSFRYANSEVYTCTVPNWSPEETGEPWKINSLVDIQDDLLGIDDTLLLGSVQFTMTETQLETSLVLKPADAYEVDIPKSKVERKKKSRQRKVRRKSAKKKKGLDPAVLEVFGEVARDTTLNNR